ncbi:MFS transporter [Zwartia panacis]|uniref:MFS transporter n=1 Tax=Zwartia panacis TaxID=2683345 RepID=UPI0025B53B96|nr:MFS transporter [Zwartia panacis]MDN4018326.1 MFS transporter [Zwartia panacis]
MTPAKPWVVLLATLTVQSLVAMALLNLPVVAPAVAKDVGISTNYLGAYVALAYFGAMVATLLGGAAVKRWGAIRLSQTGLVFAAMGLFLCAIPYVETIALGALFIGAGYGPITPASSHLLIKSTPPEKLSFVFSLKQTGVPLGGMIAGATVPSLDILIGWQWAFICAAIACAICAWAVQPLRGGLDDDRDPTVRPSLATSFVLPLKLIFSHRTLRKLSYMSFMFSIAQMALMGYLVTFLYEDLGWSLVAAGGALTVAQAAGVSGRMLWGYVSDRWLGATMMLIVIAGLLVIGAVGTALLGPESSPWFLFPVLVIFGSSAIGWNGVFLAEIARQAPKGQAGVATGGTLCITFLGVMVGPPLFGVLAGVLGSYGLSYGAMAVLGVLILMLLIPLYRHPTSSTT